MREMKDSGIEWIGNIPNDWIIGKIKNYAALKTGSTPNTNITEWFDGEINWFTPSDFTDDYILSKSIRSLSIKAISDNVVSLLPKSIVMIIGIGGTAGKVGFTVTEGYCNQQVTALIPKKISPKYLMYWLVTNTIPLRKTALYTTLPIINNQTIGNYVCISPSKLSEQEEIVNYLDNECAKLHSLISDIQSQIETLEEYKRSVITEAVTKGLDPDVEMRDSGIAWVGDIPAHWITHPLYFYFGERKNKNALGLETNLLSLSYGKIIRKDINSNGGLLPESFNTYNIIEKDDIIIRPTDLQNDKRSLRTGIAREHGIITSAYIAMKAIKSVNPEYFHYLLHAYDVMKVFYNMGNGVRQGLNFSEFSRLMVFEPTIEEQNAIVAYLKEKCDEIDLAIAEKKQQIETIEEYKKSLIFEYVTGKKEVVNE